MIHAASSDFCALCCADLSALQSNSKQDDGKSCTTVTRSSQNVRLHCQTASFVATEYSPRLRMRQLVILTCSLFHLAL